MNNSVRLIELASLASYRIPRREIEDIILSGCENLIVLSGGIKGHIWDAVENDSNCDNHLEKWKENWKSLFPRTHSDRSNARKIMFSTRY